MHSQLGAGLVEHPFEMRALAKEIKEGLPAPLKVRAHELIWVGFHLISKGTKSIRYCAPKGAQFEHYYQIVISHTNMVTVTVL